jgi:hypothetical protein
LGSVMAKRGHLCSMGPMPGNPLIRFADRGSQSGPKGPRDPRPSEARARGALACGVGSHKRRAAGPFEAASGDVAGPDFRLWLVTSSRGRPGPISRLPGRGERAREDMIRSVTALPSYPIARNRP